VAVQVPAAAVQQDRPGSVLIDGLCIQALDTRIAAK
jgi:hypothetical protein